MVVMLHLLREYVPDRMRGARWFAWRTGVPLLWLLFAVGKGSGVSVITHGLRAGRG